MGRSYSLKGCVAKINIPWPWPWPWPWPSPWPSLTPLIQEFRKAPSDRLRCFCWIVLKFLILIFLAVWSWLTDAEPSTWPWPWPWPWSWPRPWPWPWPIDSPLRIYCLHLLVKRKPGIHTSRLVMFAHLSCTHAHQEPTSNLERVLPSMEYAAPTAHACCVENEREVAWCARISITTRLLQPANQGQFPPKRLWLRIRRCKYVHTYICTYKVYNTCAYYVYNSDIYLNIL